MKVFHRVILLSSIVALCAVTMPALQQEQDELHLRNGTVLRGRLSEADNNTIVFRATDGIKAFPRSDVRMIVIGGVASTGGLPPGVSAGEGLRVTSWHTFQRVSNFGGDDAQSIRDVRISDDGNRIAFASQKGIYTIGADGSGLRQVTNIAPESWDVTPDLRRFLWYERTRGINLTRDDGGSQKLPGELSATGLKITANGSKAIVVVHTQNAVFSVNTDGSDIKKITTGEAIARVHGSVDVNGNHYRANMALSADGSRVLIQYLNDMYAMNGDGSSLRRITNYTRYGLAAFAISPDGSKLAYLDTADFAIHVMDWNGSNRRQINGESANVQAVEITNDGTVMAFMRESQTAKLRVFYPDGTLNNLEHFGGYTRTFIGMGIASMTPNAKRIAFSVAGPLATEQGRSAQIWICDIKPSSIGDAPTLTNISAFPRFLLTDASSKSVLSAESSDKDPAGIGAFTFPKNTIHDIREVRWFPYDVRLNDTGQNGDEKASDGKFSSSSSYLSNSPAAIDPGPIMLRAYSASKRDRVLVVDLEGMEARRP